MTTARDATSRVHPSAFEEVRLGGSHSGEGSRRDVQAAGPEVRGADEAATAVRWAAQIARQNSSALRVVWAWRIRDVWDEAIAARHDVEIPPMTELEDIARRQFTEVVSRLTGGMVPHVDLFIEHGPDSAGILLRRR